MNKTFPLSQFYTVTISQDFHTFTFILSHLQVKKSSVVRSSTCPQYSQSFHFKLQVLTLDCTCTDIDSTHTGTGDTGTCTDSTASLFTSSCRCSCHWCYWHWMLLKILTLDYTCTDIDSTDIGAKNTDTCIDSTASRPTLSCRCWCYWFLNILALILTVLTLVIEILALVLTVQLVVSLQAAGGAVGHLLRQRLRFWGENSCQTPDSVFQML